MYTIKLADGQTLTGLSKNGDNFISETHIDESIFEKNLSEMTVSDGETEEVFKNVELIQQVEYEDGWHLAFRELSPQELAAAENEQDMTNLQVALAEVYEMVLGGV